MSAAEVVVVNAAVLAAIALAFALGVIYGRSGR